jgi:hypothetical protein
VFRHFMQTAGAESMITTVAVNSHGYSYSNRRPDFYIARYRATHFLLQGAGQARQLNVCVVFGFQVSLVSKQEP